ncbi:MAG: hypothetical protein KDJ15_00270 [Alphaproteobacteria bacterium]|nr:hypothetical protein [Alphaproteobacteria bacterium]
MIKALANRLGLVFLDHTVAPGGNPLPSIPGGFDSYHWIACVFHPNTGNPMLMRYNHVEKTWSFKETGCNAQAFEKIPFLDRPLLHHLHGEEFRQTRPSSPEERLQAASVLFFVLPGPEKPGTLPSIVSRRTPLPGGS